MVYVHTMETPQDMIDKGKMHINVYDKQQGAPLANARITLSYTGNPDSIINELVTDSEGAVNLDELLAPPIEYSMEPGEKQPFAEYTIDVSANGYEETNISGIDVFSGETSIQDVYLNENEYAVAEDNIVIPVNTLYGNYPAKIPESEIKPLNQSGEIVLSRVVIPETIVVHDGVPTDSTALDYYVRYKEWYRNQSYNFTITSSTAFDHKWVNGRNIFESISNVVDEIFDNYLSRPNVKQPILTQYCDGKKSSCPNWMTQWGSKYLGDQGYSSIDILRYYYGDDMYINTAEQIQGIPSSWPGANLDIGSSGQKVRQLQEQLNLIGDYYKAIPPLSVDGIYGEQTAEAVRQFQRINNMPQTGVVDFPTWYRISDRYVRLSGIAELM